MVLADELDCDWKKVGFEFAPADARYKNLVYGLQLTGGSTTVRSFWEPMAKTGAAARQMLVEAAASQWNVKASELNTANGVVVHPTSGRRLSYGELVEAAAKRQPPAEPRLKAEGERKLVGKRVRRLDTADKVTGRAVFGMDVQLLGGSGGHSDTADGAELAVVTTKLTAGVGAKIVPRVSCITTPGTTIDLLVTELGLAVNPLRPDVSERLSHAGLPLKSMEELEKAAASLAPRAVMPLPDGPIVAVVEYRDGSVIDVVRAC